MACVAMPPLINWEIPVQQMRAMGAISAEAPRHGSLSWVKLKQKA